MEISSRLGEALTACSTPHNRNKYGSAQQRNAQINGLFSGYPCFLPNITLWLVLLLAIPSVTSGNLKGTLLLHWPLLLLPPSKRSPPTFCCPKWVSKRRLQQRLFEIVDTEPVVAELSKPEIEAQPSSFQACGSQITSCDYPICHSHIPQPTPALKQITFRP